MPLKVDFQVQIVQVRLNAALLMPGLELPSGHTYAPCLRHSVLDDDAVEAMSGWLAQPTTDDRGSRDRRACIAASAVPPCPARRRRRPMPGGVRGRTGYRDWRARWFVLDSYRMQPGRAERLEALLGRPVRRAI